MLFVQIIIYLILAGVFVVAYVRFMESTSVFYPVRKINATPKAVGLAYEDVSLLTLDKISLHSWFVKASNSFPETGTILFLHGNAGNVGDRLDKIELFNQLGLNVFIVDYRGYGKSKGRPSEQGMYYDAMAAFDYLLTRPDVNKEKIVVYGESLGGAAAVDLATRRAVSGLILDSTFSSAADMGQVLLPVVPSFLLRIKLDSVVKIKNVNAPKYFIHSVEDEIVPFALGEKLYNNAPQPKAFLKITGSHNDAYISAQQDFYKGIKIFLTKHNLI